jgi:hypothetical protein
MGDGVGMDAMKHQREAAAFGSAGQPVPPARARSVPAKLYRVSEIVEYSGVSRQTIHNYTTMGLITESRRTSGGHRLYDESVFGRLDEIEQLKRQNQSLRQIRTRLVVPDVDG